MGRLKTPQAYGMDKDWHIKLLRSNLRKAEKLLTDGKVKLDMGEFATASVSVDAARKSLREFIWHCDQLADKRLDEIN
ncbi:MAG: hypothetical protein OXG15_06210 [Gammaproteobacteria bacterium]|nr:hypothetical protein [Gammaproteobacteria bacterium]